MHMCIYCTYIIPSCLHLSFCTCDLYNIFHTVGAHLHMHGSMHAYSSCVTLAGAGIVFLCFFFLFQAIQCVHVCRLALYLFTLYLHRRERVNIYV